MIQYNELLARLDDRDPKPDRDGMLFFCPAHPDGQKHNKRSARAWPLADGGAGIKCFAGCDTKDVLQALGFNLSSNGDRRQEPEAIYDYKDAAGKLLYQVVRFPGKRFSQRRPDGKGDWIWDLKGVERVLYRLPETLAAVQRGETIYIPEGEKDANNLVRLDLAATSNSGGAGKWETRFADYLASADVVILPDKDEPGRKHAEKVAHSLQGKAKSIKVVELPGLPDKGDVSDWLAAGGTKEKLLKIVAEAPAWEPPQEQELFTPVVVRLSDVEPEEVSWLWEPYIPLGKLTILEGDPGIGKTWAALAITASVTAGCGLPGPDGRPGFRIEANRVVYLTAEDGLADTLRPRLDAVGADVNLVLALTGFTSFDVETKERVENPVSMQHLAIIDKVLEEHKPVLVVIDPIQAFLGAGVDMHRANEVRPVLAGMANLAEKHRCAVLLIRHLGKSQMDRAIYRGLGSIDFAAAARSVLLAGQDPDSPARRAIIHMKCSVAPLGPSVGYEIKEGQFLWTGLSELTAAKVLMPEQAQGETCALDEAKDFLRDILADGPVTAKEIEKQRRSAGISEPTLRRAKNEVSVKSIKQGDSWYWSIYIPGDHLDHVPEKLDTQGFEGSGSRRSYDHLDLPPETQAAQGLQQDDQDDHQNMFRGGVL